MTDTMPMIDHANRCQRRGAPLLRLPWCSLPELFCPECGRTAPAPDQRPTTEAATATPDDKKE